MDGGGGGSGGNWRPAQGDQQPAMGMEAAVSGDWRSQLQPDARQRIVNKILDTLKKHLPISGPEGLSELKNIAVRFEEKIYTAATSQSDYLRKISLKMLTMESKNQNSAATNSMPSNPVGANPNPTDPASHPMQGQIRNSGQLLPILSNQSQTRQQPLAQGFQNNIASSAVQSSAGLPPAMPSMAGLSQSTISSLGQMSNLQNMPGISQNSVNNSGQSMPSNIYASSQRQMQGRQNQQQIVSQQHQQQSQNSQIYQQQMFKAKLPHSSLLQSQVQQQQQPAMQETQMQSSQQPLMQISSGLQSSQTSLQQTQPSLLQSAPQSSQNLLQQSMPSLLQQHPQSVVRQQQQQQSQPSNMHQQVSSLQQQTAPIAQQSVLSLQHQQQPQLLGHQSNIPNMQQNQLLGQQNNVSDMQQQQQRLAGQQNSLLSMQQPQQMLSQQSISLHPQLGSQSNISGLQQQQSQQQQQQQHPQQQQLLGSQSSISNMQQHQHPLQTIHQAKAVAQQQLQQKQQQQQAQQGSTTLLQSQGQQSQPHPMQQQQIMSQLQSQPAQLQQQMAMQQQQNSLQREMQQRLQGVGEQQKPLFQPQRGIPEASSNSMDSTGQTGHAGPDWQDEIYQKIKSMRDSYYPEMYELYQKIILKIQQHDAIISPMKNSEQLEPLKKIKLVLERLLSILQLPKSAIQPGLKDRLPQYEKQMINFINTNRKKIGPPQLQGQQQFQHSGGLTQSMPQQPPSQVSSIQQHDSHANQMPSMNVQGSVTSMKPNSVSSLQNGSMSLSTHMGVPTTQQNMMNALQPSSNMNSSQGASLASLQQGVIGSLQQGVGSLQQTTINAQQTNVNSLVQTNTGLQPNVSSLQPNTNVLQHQHVKQEPQQQQQLLQSQQLKQQMQQQMQQRQMPQHMIPTQPKQQILQQQSPLQQQFHAQQKLQQSVPLQAHQMLQLHQMTEVNDLKVRQGSSTKPGLFQTHFSAGPRQAYLQQQLKPGASFPISSPQNAHAPSPQISQNSSPQVDQAGLLSANSPFVVPSPSTPIAPSPLLGDHEKHVSSISPLSNAGNLGHQQTSLASTQSFAVGTPGISASPLLEFTGPDGNLSNAPLDFPGKPSATERPLERLLKAVRSLSSKVLSSSVSDIGSVVSMIDRIAGSAPVNGSRAAVGEDLVAMTKCRLQARNFMSQDGSVGTKKMKRHTSAMPLNAMSSVGSVNDSIKQSSIDASELESTASSRVKRPKLEANHALMEEIKEINQQLIDTVVDITDEDAESIAAAAESEGTVVKCSFCAISLSPSLKSQFASAKASPILPLQLLVPANYPNCSPVLLDKIPVELSSKEFEEFEDLSAKAKSRFNTSLRGLPQPMSLREMVRAWDVCARKVIEEHVQQSGGGSFSSRYGTWENCLTA